jgi:hypothetical protein
MLQTQLRDPSQELLQRSKADSSYQRLMALEENLLGKAGVDTAMCTYYMKTAHAEAMTPCETLDLLQTTFRESLKDFAEFDKMAKDTLTKVLADLTDLKNLQTAQSDFGAGLMAEGVELARLTKAMKEAEEKLGDASEFAEALAVLSTQAKTKLENAVAEVREDIKSVMEGETLTMPDGLELFNPQELLTKLQGGVDGALKEAEEQLFKYAMEKFVVVIDVIGQHVAQFWRAVLKLPEGAVDPFDGVQWNEEKNVKKLEKIFWHVAQGYLDLVDHVETGCKSQSFNPKKAEHFGPRMICKDNSKPECVDEFLYLAAVANVTDDAACAEVDGLGRKGSAKDLAFLVDGDICKTGNDLQKACKIITKAEQKAAREAKKGKRGR